MFRKLILTSFLGVFLSLQSVATVQAAELSISSAYVEGKVNDPVSKGSVKASIFDENPLFVINDDKDITVDVIVYSNDHLEGEDRGIRNRVSKRSISAGEEFRLLPDELYDAAVSDGSIYDFLNHCYVLRVYSGTEGASYKDYYIGIVDYNIFAEMYEAQEERIALELEKKRAMGPAAKD